MLDNTNISKHLGQKSEYKAQYDPTLLVREPRQSNRTYLDIDDDNLPFVGYDTWNGYEISGLTNNGIPVVGIVKLSYNCNNKFIVESKSLKLYFNSFVMTKLGNTSAEVLKSIEDTATKDLSNLLETEVKVHVFTNKELVTSPYTPSMWHTNYTTLEDIVDLSSLTVDVYKETPSLLETYTYPGEYRFHSSLLRSLCRVTSQQDTGDIFIYIAGNKVPTPASLLKYIISYREECHFHEEICEAVYKRLYDALKPEELSVKCLYARRGSIDICPARASSFNLIDDDLANVLTPHTKLPKQ
jgi:7-cyano-7-deazaguanine reductase